jgi:hypothetical protein
LNSSCVISPSPEVSKREKTVCKSATLEGNRVGIVSVWYESVLLWNFICSWQTSIIHWLPTTWVPLKTKHNKQCMHAN